MGEKNKILSILREIIIKLEQDEDREDIIEFIDCKIKDIEKTEDVASNYIDELVSSLK